jgi:catechol 2,3-dioxygenase-like lactoylglutathione lyase family enzyme
LSSAYPQLFVSDMAASCEFFRRLGFSVAFTYGEPPFFAQIRRDRARLNLRHVDGPVFAPGVRDRDTLLAAHIPVEGVTALHAEFRAAGAVLQQSLMRQRWGAEDFVLRDPDGNLICFSSLTDLQD